MTFKRILIPTLIALAAAGAFQTAHAIGGGSGPRLDYEIQGQIGEVVINPYGIAPLTAIIRNGGYVLEKAHVRIVPKNNGREIAYDVSKHQLMTHGGIPVFGLYPDYLNKVEVSYTRNYNGELKDVKETYDIYAAPIYGEPAGRTAERTALFTTEVVKVDQEFADRLYFINNISSKPGKSSRVVWNNPMGGALEWNFNPQNAIIDTAGDIRWYMFAAPIYDLNSIDHAGVMMGFKQNDDGAMSWAYGQRYVKYDIMGRRIFDRDLPFNYNDFSHSMDNAQNGHYFLRVASSNYKRPDGKNVRTVRDVITEVDENGVVVDEWRLFDILDPYREDVLKALDQGAVCLNIDASKAGQTLTEEEIKKLDTSDTFGDVVGTGPGRNWAHVNSVDYDPSDDSIIISSRHQSAIIKIGRDKKVKWILGAPRGWKGDFASKVLVPVDKNGKKITCSDVACEGGFDWTWTQHTGFRIDEKSNGDVIYVSAFDNGDARGMEQPPLPDMKYSRAVVYKIDQKKMTVEQVWEYGKERGNAFYSSVTSLTQYQPDHDSIFVYSATADSQYSEELKRYTSNPNPYLLEFKWGAKVPAVEIRLHDTQGYQAMPFSVKKAFEQ